MLLQARGILLAIAVLLIGSSIGYAGTIEGTIQDLNDMDITIENQSERVTVVIKDLDLQNLDLTVGKTVRIIYSESTSLPGTLIAEKVEIVPPN